MDSVVESIRRRDLSGLRSALAVRSFAPKPQHVLEAARCASLEALELLQAAGGDLNASWRGYRPLHALIQEGPHGKADVRSAARLECLRWLLSHGADPELPAAWPPARAVIVSAFTGIPEYIRVLLDAGAGRDVFVACALGDRDAVAELVSRQPAVVSERDVGGLTLLQCCAGSRLWRESRTIHSSLLGIARLLLLAGADPLAKTKSWDHDIDAGYLAIAAGNGEILELLLSFGVDATSMLSAAAWNENDRFCEICLNHGGDLNSATDAGKPLLNQMIRWGQLRRVFWLLEHGADPNRTDSRGWTAVHQAASRGNERMFQAVIAAGGDLSLEDREGRTPLEVAKPERGQKLAAAITKSE